MKKNLLKLGLLIFLSFLGFTFLVSLGLLGSIDLVTTKFLQIIIPRSLDLPFSLLSLIGSAEIVSIFILILWVFYRKLNIIFVLINFVIFHVIELFSKAYITHLGPPRQFVRYFFEFSFPSSGVKPGSSYPSGHVGRTMFISALLIFVVSKSNKLKNRQKQFIYISVLIFDFLMVVSRVYLGEHWLSDVIGGGILGAAFGIVALIFG